MARSSSRARLPRDLSYPVLPQELRAGLEGLPDDRNVSLTFWRYPPGLRASEHRRLLQSGSPIPALEGTYSDVGSRVPPAARSREPKSYYQPRWSVHVYAVPRTLRPVVHDALSMGGIEAVREWLQRPRSQTWLDGFRWYLVSVDPASGELSTEERE